MVNGGWVEVSMPEFIDGRQEESRVSVGGGLPTLAGRTVPARRGLQAEPIPEATEGANPCGRAGAEH
eukprot:4671661-Pyramimonas_sp.AAC.1